MKVIMVGGGTGGHIYPAIAIAEAVQEKIIDSKILFIGSEEGIETKIVPKERFSLVTIKARGMLRKLTYKSISSPFFAITGFFQSIGIIRSFQPQAIVATGGFVSLPVVLAGFFLRIPVILHEGNVTPGLATRICKWFASGITIAFEGSRKYYKFRKVYHIGGPVRKEIIRSVKSISIQHMGIRQDLKTVLVTGGSQGAKSINNVIIDALPELAKNNVQVIHVCGERDYQWVKEATLSSNFPFYHLIPYMYNIWDGLAAADIVISRAGATAISEIIAKGLPSILIPFPFSAEGHQDHNAAALQKAGACIVIKDREFNKDNLMSELNKIINDKQSYLNMSRASSLLGKPDAASQFVSIMLGILGVNLNARKRKNRSKKS